MTKDDFNNISLKSIVSCMPGSVYWKNREGKYLGCNNAMLEAFGLSKKDVIGHDDYYIVEKLGWPRSIADSLRAIDLIVMETGLPKLNIEETPFHDKNGNLIQQITNKVPLYNKSGLIIGILGNSTDITIRKKMEAQLRREKELAEMSNEFSLESIIACMPGSVYWKNKEGQYLGCNDALANLLGIGKEEIIGHNDYYLGKKLKWPKSVADSLRAVDLMVMETGVSKLNVEETPFYDKNGKLIQQITNKVPLYNKNGLTIGVLGNSIDITDRKNMEIELKKAKEAAEAGERAKTEFIANVSHDIRTPLTGLINIALDVENTTTDPGHKERFKQVADCGNALYKMLVQVLENIKAEHMTEKDVKQVTFDINELIKDLTALEKPTATQKGLKFITTLDPNVPTFLISDYEKIHRMNLNLLGNAFKFTKQGHVELKIELLKKNKDLVTLKFSVIDTGIGVSPEDKKHLFERFYKGSPSFKAEYKGYGLGLSEVKCFAELLHGTIDIDSTQGVGTQFSVILKLKVANEHEIKLYKENLTQKASLLKMKPTIKKPTIIEKPSNSNTIPAAEVPYDAPHVLVIEDDPVVRRILVNMLKNIKLKFTEASDGETALALAKTESFDLILSDVGLPGISGIVVTQQLRDFEKKQGKKPVSIVGVTGHAETNECIEAGMDAVILKPLTREMFLEIVQTFLPDFTPPS